MEPNRYFHLRNLEGFSPEQFERFRQNCVTWQLLVSEGLCNWSSDIVHAKSPVPEYEFGSPELSSDGCVATLPIGGEPDYVGVKSFEDYYPPELWRWFPVEFTRDFELAYVFPGIYDEPLWHRIPDKEIDEFPREDYLYGWGKHPKDPLKKTEGLSEKQLFVLPYPHARCIIWYVGHIAYQENVYLDRCLHGREVDALEKYGVFEQENASAEDVRQSIDSVENVFTWVRQTSQKREDYFASIDKQQPFSVLPASEKGLSVAHWLYILATHTARHIWHMDALCILINQGC